MDFLDPRKKRSRKLRLIISYALMATLAVTGALIFVYSSFGYGINTKTGKIVQNGLVFVDSAPVKAEIFLNGQDTNKKTSARLVLPEDSYDLSIQSPGYRNWNAVFHLGPQSVLRLNYALMIPTNLSPATFASSPTPLIAASQSPDGKYIVVLTGSSKLSLTTYSGSSLAAQPQALPAGLAKLPGGSWQPVGWSSNSNLLLLEHQSGKQSEYVVINRSNPSNSINLTSVAGTISEARWVPSSNNQLFVLKGVNLDRFDLSSSQLSLQFSGAETFEALSNNRVLFSSGQTKSQVIKIWDGSQTYELRQLNVAADGQVLLAAASYQGHDYYAVSATDQAAASIYVDPLGSLRSSNSVPPQPLATLKINHPDQLSFSPGGRILLAASVPAVATYDLEVQSTAEFVPKYPLAAPLTWQDSFHLSGLTKSSVAAIADYDGANQQLLVKSNLPAGFYLGPDNAWMFSYLGSAQTKFQKTSLTITH